MEDATELIPPPPPPPSVKPSLNDGDWTCNDCGNVNFARRNQCNRCHKNRPNVSITTNATKKRKLGHEIGKAAAEKSRGLFSADDWQCNKCGNVNWARRQQCNVCNAPKFGDVEERTGFGGGYNDRGVVEYKEHTESDDEYDEFGRRKKRRSLTKEHDDDDDDDDKQYDKKIEKKDSKNVKKNDDAVEKVKEKKKAEVEEDDEDDDDDDDGDLSKYDLSDWGGDSSDATNKRSNNSRSRSRSRSPHSRY